MDVLKVFHEEPAATGRLVALPPLGGDIDGDALLAALRAAPIESRLYLSGTHTRDDGSALSALSALPPGAWLAPLLAVLDTRPDGTPDARRWASAADPAATPDLAATPLALWARHLAAARIADGDAASADALARVQRRPSSGSATLDRPSLHALLDGGATILVPEPVADGFDLSVYAPAPLRGRLADALAAHPSGGVRRFLAPYRTTRSEARFHFDRWEAGMPLPAGIVEL